MLNRLRNRKSRREFQRAKAEASAAEAQVCGTIAEDGRPLYFLMPKEASNDAIARRAFEVRHGRKITDAELYLIEKARKHMASA